MAKKSVFLLWIDEVGASKLAQKLGIHPSCVTHWKQGKHRPRVHHMKEIVRLSKGALTYEDIMFGGGQ